MVRPMRDSARMGDSVTLSVHSGSLPERLSVLLRTIPDDAEARPYGLDELSLLLGLRLPEVAQTETYWHLGETGRRMRALGFGVQVEYGRVIFVRRTSRSR
jgi:hypothetical protein